mmetsp:Transcript_11821/g.21603  ORF Transcript_11821/g.21603 Transcript_11821/m.21603 type:complete len:158 (-) Transcript_11821:295-768(-)|eukprot:CAMPEP_0197519918 /NCGR_PEP_ID=MMETSP1318-20131121/5212_1 /TAXON_ID=552666 /ORGANISM="Partenskyella glossopodia, Strain RCC365" /LENGTH=157 /DNA_ID=CAMNT_0043071177 /DNA_START=68 /DNA_END=541 /DNA_ORIENTATION=-
MSLWEALIGEESEEEEEPRGMRCGSDTIVGDSKQCERKVDVNWKPVVVDLPEFRNRDLEAGYEEGLFEAARIGDEESIRKYLQKGAMVNFPNGLHRMQSALHIACMEGHLDSIFLLLDNEGDLNQKDADGLTPVDACNAAGRKDIEISIRLYLANLM